MQLTIDIPKCKDYRVDPNQAVNEMKDWTTELGIQEAPEPSFRLRQMIQSGATQERRSRDREGRSRNFDNRRRGRDDAPWMRRGSQQRRPVSQGWDSATREEREPYQKKWNLDKSLGRNQFEKQFREEWKRRDTERRGEAM